MRHSSMNGYIPNHEMGQREGFTDSGAGGSSV